MSFVPPPFEPPPRIPGESIDAYQARYVRAADQHTKDIYLPARDKWFAEFDAKHKADESIRMQITAHIGALENEVQIKHEELRQQVRDLQKSNQKLANANGTLKQELAIMQRHLQKLQRSVETGNEMTHALRIDVQQARDHYLPRMLEEITHTHNHNALT